MKKNALGLKIIPAIFFLTLVLNLVAQPFYFGADLSYVNEMEDCGAVYKEEGTAKDPYALFADRSCNLVRLRLWHTPSWYDSLNEGKRYSDLQDVRRSIRRAKQEGMEVLLDFHLSDNWADPSKQVAPQAWQGIVGNLPVLKDSLYNYIYQTLYELHAEDLWPDMIQIGNETNKGILLSEADNAAGWMLDWPRNSQLFNSAIQAAREAEAASGKALKIVVHAAGPEDAGWIFDQFIENGVTDFDVMGISYYWAWHKPTTIAETGRIIADLRQRRPAYEVMIVETGYIWTNEAADQANNIISEVHPDYSPASPDNQRLWLIDLTKAVMANDGLGVVYWEPAWVSTDCFTQWGRGSHQEHATFFDFNTNLIPNGGIAWMSYDYQNTTNVRAPETKTAFRVYPDSNYRRLILEYDKLPGDQNLDLLLVNNEGKTVLTHTANASGFGTPYSFALPDLTTGVYFVIIRQKDKLLGREKIWILQN